jgi:UDP-N-acetylmuramoyl-L-alanyl-D-glutamate--2,6-diaminopimelate ligase
MLFNDFDIKKAVINIDNPFGKRISENIPKSIDKLDVSLEGSTKSKPLINGSIKKHDSNGLIIDVESDFGKGQIKSPLTGRFNAQNLLLSLGILLSEGFQLDNIINAFQFIPLPPGRMQSINGYGEQKIIIDYAHTPDGLEHSLKTIKEIYHGKVCVVFGCGGDRDNKKRPLMGSMAEKYADEIIITDDNPRTESSKNIINDILNGIHDKKRTQTISDRYEAILYALKASSYNDIVLISGKGHEEKQIYRTKEYDFSDQRCVEEILKIK